MLILIGISTGDIALYLVLIIPVLVMKGPMGLLAILFIVAGTFLSFAGLSVRGLSGAWHIPGVRGAGSRGRGWSIDPEGGGFGGVIFLGPIPIVFGNRRGMRSGMVKVGVVIGALLVIFFVLQVLLLLFVLFL